MMNNDYFTKRLVELRMLTGASARDMSLSLGQSPSYINNIENGKNLPSFHMFFYICEFLNVTPEEFFALDTPDPPKVNELVHAVRGLSGEQLDHLIALARGIRKS